METESEGSTSGETPDGTDGSTSTTSADADTSSTTGDETTSAETTSDGTTGANDAELAAACEGACAALIGCVPDEWESVDECVGLCLDLYDGETEACIDAGFALMNCYAGHSCDELSNGACEMAEEIEVVTCGGGDL